MKNNEYNVFEEYQKFEETTYIKEVDKNSIGREENNNKNEHLKTTEIGNYSTSRNTTKKKEGGLKKLVQKVMESTKTLSTTIATTAVVAVGAIVVLVNIIAPQAKFELNYLNEGANFVEYSITASELDENTDYYVLIHNSKESHQFDINEGDNINKFTDLVHNSVYELSVIGYNNDNNTSVTYINERFFTLTNDNSTFNATYNIIDETSVVISWGDPNTYSLAFNTDFDNFGDDTLSYKIILTDVLTNEVYIYSGIDKTCEISIPSSVEEVSITYEFIQTINNVENILEKVELPNSLVINTPEIILSDNLELVGINKFTLPLTINTSLQEEVYTSILLKLTYSDSTTEEVFIEDFNVNSENLITLDVPNGVSSIKVDCDINMLAQNGHNERTVTSTKEYTLENQYDLTNIVVDKVLYNETRLSFIYHFIDSETTIGVKNLNSSEIITLYVGNNYVGAPFDSALSSAEYTYYLSNSTGDPIGTENNITVDTSIDPSSYSSLYEFSYTNPGDIVVTYNDDGTINLYNDTNFSTTDDSIYYTIKYTNDLLGEFEVKYTSAIAKLEDTPYGSYYISYNVYKEINDIAYLIYEVTPSGGVELYSNTIENAITIDGNVISFSFSKYMYVFDDTSFVITIDGVDYNADASCITLDDLLDQYTFTYTALETPTNVKIRFKGGKESHTLDYERIALETDVKGNLYETINVIS